MAKPIKVVEGSNKSPKMEMTIRLDDLFGTDVPDDPALRLALGQEVIDAIVERTEGNEYLNKNAPKKYSKSYASSEEFAIYGKSRGDVNLTQSGSLLGSLDILRHDEDEIVIGWTSKDNKLKAHGHQTGNGIAPQRKFLGLKPGEVDGIRGEFAEEIEAVDKALTASQEEKESSITFALTEILRRLNAG